MSKNILLLFFLIFSVNSFAQEVDTTKSLILIGKVAKKYVPSCSKPACIAKITIKNSLITEIKKGSRLTSAERNGNIPILKLKTGRSYDYIYPGLVDLHNHTKQNILPVWSLANGQYTNRHEWRKYSKYKDAVSMNMNDWIKNPSASCLSFRWSELQAMVIGTTYLQGPSQKSCVNNFAIKRVEDSDSFLNSPKNSVSAPTDLIYPNEFSFVYNTLGDIIRAGGVDENGDYKVTYADAMLQTVHKYCPSTRIGGANELTSVVDDIGTKFLRVKANVEAACTEIPEDEKYFVRYAYYLHKTVVNKINYLNDPNRSAYIVHLAEGRRFDAYNTTEFDTLRLLGLDKEGLTLVHAVSGKKEVYQHMAKKKIGMVWSPYSNLLLYGETAPVAMAQDAGVTIALGSDWTPTGSRGVLEELKLAEQYIKKIGKFSKEKKAGFFTYEDLVNMVTENPAKLINHYENNPEDNDPGIGTIKVGAIGTLIIVNAKKVNNKIIKNPYENLVKADATDLNLVVIDGKPIYGNKSYLQAYDKNYNDDADEDGVENYEVVSGFYFDNTVLMQEEADNIPTPPEKNATKEEKKNQVIEFALTANKLKLKKSASCGFREPKVMAITNSIQTSDGKRALREFADQSIVGINADKFKDINKFLAVSIFTQSRNMVPGLGKPEDLPGYFPPLYSCLEPEVGGSYNNLYRHVQADGNDIMQENIDNRLLNRASNFFQGNVSKKIMSKYRPQFETYEENGELLRR